MAPEPGSPLRVWPQESRGIINKGSMSRSHSDPNDALVGLKDEGRGLRQIRKSQLWKTGLLFSALLEKKLLCPQNLS